MQTFTPREYLYIDLANHYGLDKETWNTRIQWTLDHLDDLEIMADTADSPILFRKAIRALDDSLHKRPSGHLISLDATASGLQIMSAMAGCESGCILTNLIDSGDRRDIYQEIATEMSSKTRTVSRSELKHPIMTHYYGSKAQPKRIFGEYSTDLALFYTTLQSKLEGGEVLMDIMQDMWQSDALAYEWRLPDGHTARFKVMVPESKRIEVDELNHATFTYRKYFNKPQKKGLALAANIVHSIDGYIVREMVRRCKKQGFAVLSIHDSFWCHPNYGNQLRQTYNSIFAECVHIKLFNDISRQIHRYNPIWDPIQDGLNQQFYDANYALS